MLPSIFRENLWDNFVDDMFYGSMHRSAAHAMNNSSDMMRTDVKETDNAYEITTNLPGIKKEDVKLELKDSALIISASTDTSNKDSSDKYVRRERFVGSFTRSFYVGNDVKQEDIKARFENGTLVLTVPKKVQQPEVETSRYIPIE